MTSQRTDKRICDHVAALSSPNKKVAERAEILLIRHYGSRPVDLLIEACNSLDENTRFRAAWILGKTHDGRALDTLVRLTEDPSSAVRYDATLALGHLGDLRAIEPLIRIMCAPNLDDGVASVAVEALAMLGKPTIPTLTILAKSDDPEILRKVARTLSLLKDETTIAMAEALSAHPNTDVRVTAIDALEEIAAAVSARSEADIVNPKTHSS